MNFLELLLIAFSVSMDAFAVSITDGLCCKNLQKKQFISIGLCFGILQGLMPVIGFFLGQTFASYIRVVDHYVALILLGYIGGKMIFDAITESKKTEPELYDLNSKIILMQGIATSIDALALGVSFSALANIKIMPIVTEIMLITGLLSIMGVCFGKHLGKKFGSYALFLGGFILIALGVKIFVEHVFFS
ncbi:MAG: manganese efflux pump MntP family protein [Oscillospiraceae bacterium]|nr:manganese efflux pump MntP family protein [Oscillospiraceae bacterium]